MERGTNDTSRRSERARTALAAGIPVLLCASLVLVASGPSHFDPDEAIEASARARRAFGLRADETSHRRAIESETAAESLDKYGMALTREELTEMDRRQDVADRMAPVMKELSEEAPDSFAGMYVDHEDEGTLVVLATRPNEIDSGKIADLVDGKPFRVSRVDRSAKQLREDQESVQAMAAKLLDSGEGGLVGVELSETDNTVRVLVKDQATRGRLETALESLGLPSYVEFEERHLQFLTPVRASDSIYGCSAGPTVYRDIPQLGGRFYYMLTAKHCPNVQQHLEMGHGCSTHGLRFDAQAMPKSTIYGPGIFADVQAHWTGLSGADGYIDGGESRRVVGEGVLDGYGDTAGTLVRRRGAASSTTTGNVDRDVDAVVACSRPGGDMDFCSGPNGAPGPGESWFWLGGLRRAVGMRSVPGDSGGIVYKGDASGSDYVVLGLVSIAETVVDYWGTPIGYNTLYSHIAHAHDELNEEGFPFIVQRYWD